MARPRLWKWSVSVTVVFVACAIMWLGVHYANTVRVKEYDFNGTVVAVHPDTRTVRVHNQNIPGLMAPMDMDYQVTDKEVVSHLKPGDVIHAKLVSSTQGQSLQNVTIKKTP